MRRLASIPLALLVALLGLAPSSLAPSTPDAFVVGEGSRFWIDGTSTVNSFTCEAPEVAGFGTVEPEEVEVNATETGGVDVDAVVAIAVRTFDCGVRQMNRDLYDALKARQYPAIRFALERAEVLDQHPQGEWAKLRAWGTLTLAGTERSIVLTAEGRRYGGANAEVRGSHTLRMTDFNIDPPTGLLGLVRAHDQITVRFHLVATATN